MRNYGDTYKNILGNYCDKLVQYGSANLNLTYIVKIYQPIEWPVHFCSKWKFEPKRVQIKIKLRNFSIAIVLGEDFWYCWSSTIAPGHRQPQDRPPNSPERYFVVITYFTHAWLIDVIEQWNKLAVKVTDLPIQTIVLLVWAQETHYVTKTYFYMKNIFRVTGQVNGGFPHKGQSHGALMFSLIFAWTNG